MQMRFFRLWLALVAVIVLSLAVLGYYGLEIYRQAPPIPQRVVVRGEERTLFSGEDIRDGQNAWQTMGGQQVGSVWGHGAYIAPDWSADWLHREATWLLDHWAAQEAGAGVSYETLPAGQRAALRERLKEELRTNEYNAGTGDLTVSPDRAAAIAEVSRHYEALFSDDPVLADLRRAYAIPANILLPERREDIAAFFFWAAWACATDRPSSPGVSYTNNWPSEALIDNRPTGHILVWSVVSFILLLAGVGAFAWYIAAEREEGEEDGAPDIDPLASAMATPSMTATIKYFWTAAALLAVQIGMGILTAHYGVEGDGLYGIPLSEVLPYAVTRTWHTQLGIFWIATTWLATGLFLAPLVGGREPRFQRAGVNLLWVCLVIIVGGSMLGQWLGVQQKLGYGTNFWLGHQGYEYVDLGRFWQIFLFAGLFIWLFLMARAMRPAFRDPSENPHLLGLFLLASAAIGLFYGAGLMWGRRTHLSMVEYWRWWVVHLWVEGFFEVFATVAIAYLFSRMGLIRKTSAAAAALFSSAVFLSGGIIGTMHHLYFSGTPTAVLALGACFSALEVVPLVLIGFEGYENLRLGRARPWVSAYKWPIRFFVAVAFWNLVGAGLFGFFINPPIALYYMQGLNTTPVHGHTALFGVYGMLGMGLMLFCLRALAPGRAWKEGAVSFAFWAINIGLALMVLLSLLPVGLLQAWESLENGMWSARSAEFLQQPLMSTLRWMRVPGDTIFAAGVASLLWFIAGLKTGWSLKPVSAGAPEILAAPAKGPSSSKKKKRSGKADKPAPAPGA
jgi:nitric oxide reductase subunit B